MKKNIIYLFVLLPLILAACGNGDETPAGSGMIEATEVIVSAQASGTIESLMVAKGDRIVSGDVIAIIDTVTSVLQLRQANAVRYAVLVKLSGDSLIIEKVRLSKELAAKEFNRISRLLKTGSANQQQYDKVENSYSQAKLAEKTSLVGLRGTEAELARVEAEIKLLEKRLSDCRPLAPLDGTIIETFVEAGELASPGKALIKIARLDTVEVKIYIPPSDLTRIKIGGQAEIDPEDGREAPIHGTIVWVSPKAEFTPKNIQTKEARADLVYAIKISIPNLDESLKIGMPVAVRIP
ncbi:MAG: efflux RND transporter periplasmic adaptor subunit [candidate division Zixibacteria bacterium]|nr:efflux RND transporter periplasmic adaptor subunit [candidate division Zixibacteria bacterium]